MSEGLEPPSPPAPEAGSSPSAPEAGSSPPARPSSHRAPTPGWEAARRLVPPLAAVAAVLLVIVLLLWLNGPAHTSGPGPALQQPTALATTTAEPTPSPTPRRTTASPTHTAPATEPAATARAAARQAPVTVLNNSRVQHLASRVSEELAGKGWPIRTVGNFTGRISASTVYYAPGQSRIARALAKDFPAIQRVLPRFRGLPGSGVTLVVTRYWPH